MAGRARKGPDARGHLGDTGVDVELVDETEPKEIIESSMNVGRKGFGIGLLVIVIGIVIWCWPYFNFWVLGYIQTLSTGPRFIAYGILMIILSIIADKLLRRILNLILD